MPGVPQSSPTANNLLIGAGNLYLDRFTSAGARQGYFHVGNCELIELNIEDTSIEKYSSMHHARPLYARRLQRRLVTVRVQMDEFSKENMALWMMGQNLVGTTQAATAVVGETLFLNIPAATLGGALGGKTFHVAKFGAISAVAVKVAAAALVEGTDYTVNLADGTITILEGSTQITNGTDDLLVDYTPTAYTTVNQIAGGSEALIECGLLYISDNTSGPNWQIEAWKCQVSPDGALGLISEEYATATISLAVQDDSAGAYGGSVQYPLFKLTYLNKIY